MPRASSPALAARRRPSAAANPSTSPSTLSTILNHSIPPFYACYLLKSYNPKRPHMTYIGSTPDPPRRWKQHMGDRVGGALKTRFGRPWEMEAIVHGFPSKLQALQFEWCWQNPEASRLLRIPAPPPPDPPAAPVPSASAVAPKRRKKAAVPAPKTIPQFPRKPLSHHALPRVQVLQYMLTVPPWSRFDLSVTLFSEQAREWWGQARRAGPVVRTEAGLRKWEKEREKMGLEDDDPWGVEKGKKLDSVRLHVRTEGVEGERLVREGKRKEGEQLERLRVDDDDFFHFHWDKFLSLSSATDSPDCYICRKPIDTRDHLSFHLCTALPASPASPPCLATFHPLCLSSHFLTTASSASTSTAPAPLLPTTAPCPSCLSDLSWIDLVRGMYRRDEESKGKRKKRVRQQARKGGAKVDDEDVELEEGEGDEGGEAKKRVGRKKKKNEQGSDADEPAKEPRAKAGVKDKGRATGKASTSKKTKGKAKAVSPASSDSDADADEAFYFSDAPSQADLNSLSEVGAAVDAGAGFAFNSEGDDSDVERSFARMDAAIDANAAGEAAYSDWQDDVDLDIDLVVQDASPKPKKSRTQKASSSPAPPASPKRRGRPPKKTDPVVVSLSDELPSPPKKQRRTKAAPAAPTSLFATFSTTKASVAATMAKGGKGKSAALSLSESEGEGLPPPAALGKAAPAKAKAVSPKARRKKAVKYVELSD